MKSISYLWHLKQTKQEPAGEVGIETRHRLTVKLDLMDKHVDKHVSEHVGEHVGEHLGEQRKSPWPKFCQAAQQNIPPVGVNVLLDQHRQYKGKNLIILVWSFPVWKSSRGTCRRPVFLRELGYELVKPLVERRSQVPNLHSAIREAMASIGVGPVPHSTAAWNILSTCQTQTLLILPTQHWQESVMFLCNVQPARVLST